VEPRVFEKVENFRRRKATVEAYEEVRFRKSVDDLVQDSPENAQCPELGRCRFSRRRDP